VFAAARNALYSRYTDNDWMASNMSNYLASNRVRGASERVRHDTVTMCHELDDKTRRTQVSTMRTATCGHLNVARRTRGQGQGRGQTRSRQRLSSVRRKKSGELWFGQLTTSESDHCRKMTVSVRTVLRLS